MKAPTENQPQNPQASRRPAAAAKGKSAQTVRHLPSRIYGGCAMIG
jgi:hypothetical protein